MDRECNSDLQISSSAAAALPPAMIGEAGWDILLALSANGRSGLTCDKLGSIASISEMVVDRWLEWLQERELVATGRYKVSNELGAAITPAGRELIENHHLTTRILQSCSRH